MVSCFGEPEVESREGAGERVTESVWEMRWDRLGMVSLADELRRGQGGEEKGRGEVGVMRPGGRGVSGLMGNMEDSRSNIWRML